MPSDSLNLSIRLFCEMNTDTYPNIYDFPKCCNVAICGDIHGDFNLLVNKVEQEEAVNCFRSLYLWVDLQLSTGSLALSTVVNCFRSLYLWVDLQHHIKNRKYYYTVVNCFRSLYLWVDLQRVNFFC